MNGSVCLSVRPSVCLSVCHTFLAATKQLYKWYFPSVCPSVCPSHLFSCDQAALWMVQSVRPSVCLSVTPFSLCSHHRIIMKFSGVITNDKTDVHAKGQDQRSKVKVTEVMTPLSRFRTVTPVWNHIWWWNDAYSLMLLRRGALLFFKVIDFEPFNDESEMIHKAWCSIEDVPFNFSGSSIKFQGHTGEKSAIWIQFE